MTSAPIHSAASHEFLSRLHDGELSPAEAARFQSHRETCAECREAVDTFERALAVYRAAPTGAPSSDLSARILRNVRAQSPSRRPFGVTFGIDIRWAGAMVAAILVALVAAPILLRKGVPRSSAPIPVVLDSRAEPGAPAKTLTSEDEPESARPAAPAPRRQASAESAREKDSADKTDAADRAAEVPPVTAQGALAPAAQEPAPPSESKEDRRELSAVASASAPATRLSIRALDGQGQPPELASRIPEDRLAALRGLEFELVVRPDGGILEVKPSAPSADGLGKKKEPAPEPDPRALLGLRFAAGETPRRLLLRIE